MTDSDQIESVYRVIEQLEKRIDSSITQSKDAVALAHNDLSKRLEGFPQQFATKTEMEEAARAVQRLEKDSLSREMYDTNHRTLVDTVGKLDKDKLNESVFDTFVDNYRLEQERAAAERRDVAALLASATEKLRVTVAEERSDYLTQDAHERDYKAIQGAVNAVERWQYKIVGALVFATFVAPLVTGIVVYLFVRSLPPEPVP